MLIVYVVVCQVTDEMHCVCLELWLLRFASDKFT